MLKRPLAPQKEKLKNKLAATNYLLDLGYSESVVKNMLRSANMKTKSRKRKYNKDEVCLALTLNSIRKE